jgi:hypothetical protein
LTQHLLCTELGGGDSQTQQKPMVAPPARAAQKEEEGVDGQGPHACDVSALKKDG